MRDIYPHLIAGAHLLFKNGDFSASISDPRAPISRPGIVDRTIPVAIIHSDKALVAELVYAVG